MADTIALIMLTYNRAAYVGEAVRSVMAQTDGDWDLLVYDDGSTDGTVEAARATASGDGRVRIIEADHRGFPGVLQDSYGHRHGGASLVGWVDSDDMLEPECLERTRAALAEDPEAGMVYTSYRDMDAQGRLRGIGRRARMAYSPEALLLNFMTFHFRLIRVSAIEQIGGLTPEDPAAWDYDLCLKLSEVTKIIHLPVPLYRYRHHEATISQQHRLLQIEASAKAIERALERRGCSEEVALKLELVGRFSLRDRKTGRSVSPRRCVPGGGSHPGGVGPAGPAGDGGDDADVDVPVNPEPL